MPVVDVVLIGPIQRVEFLLHSEVEFTARIFLLWAFFIPAVFLAQAIEFGNG